VARQPLILIAWLAACREDEPYDGSFEVPVAAGVLQPERGSPWVEPVAYVANGVGGQIVPLLAKKGTFLVDDTYASFLPSRQLPTGGARALQSVAVWASPACADARAPDAPAVVDCQVTVWAGDARDGGSLVEVPHVLRVEAGFPVEGWTDVDGEHLDGATWDRADDADDVADAGDITFEDVDQSGNTATLSAVEIKSGWTTTEDWTVTWDGVAAWRITGSRSGPQEKAALPGEPWVGDERRLAFTVDAAGTCGDAGCDRFTLQTRSGVVDHDIGGVPLALALSTDRATLASIVHDRVTDLPVLRFLRPDTGAVAIDVPLAEGALPNRISWGEDGLLWVADRGRASVWSVAPNGTATEIPLPFRTLDVALLGSTLFVVAEDGYTVWRLDRDTGALLDGNPWVPDAQGMAFDAPVNGIEAIPVDHLYVGVDDGNVRLSGRTIAVALASSEVMFLEEDTGCLMQDIYGPRTLATGSYGSSLDYSTNFDDAFYGTYGAFLEANALNDRHVMVAGCAGTAKPENWTLRFDEARQGWEVEGNRSGVQGALAIEDQRYVSDDGSVSFVVRAGAAPSAQGWQITFVVDDGIATATGDENGDQLQEWLLANPADPIFFHYTVGPTPDDLGWKTYDDRGFVLVLGTGSDRVGRVDPQEADIDIAWQ
jgi:hypothetical protein